MYYMVCNILTPLVTYDDSSFYAILLTGDGAVTIAQRTPEGGLKEVARFSNPRIAPAGRPNVLTVTEETLEDKPSFTVAINGESIGSFSTLTVEPGGRVGIAYSGIGNHGFEDLEIRIAQPHAAPTVVASTSPDGHHQKKKSAKRSRKTATPRAYEQKEMPKRSGDEWYIRK